MRAACWSHCSVWANRNQCQPKGNVASANASNQPIRLPKIGTANMRPIATPLTSSPAAICAPLISPANGLLPRRSRHSAHPMAQITPATITSHNRELGGWALSAGSSQ